MAGWMADHWGRKNALLSVGIPYALGYLLITLAQLVEDSDSFKALILVGRLVTGLGMGWSCGVSPVRPISMSHCERKVHVKLYGSYIILY